MNIAIVGAGAAGLFLAKLIAKNKDLQIYIFEKNSKPGFKIKASGGGKANIFNTHISGECYNNSAFIADLLCRVTPQTIAREFENMGLRMSTDEEGRVYPATFFSQTVLDVLLENLPQNVHFEYDYIVLKFVKINNYFKINNLEIKFDKLIWATGSPAGVIAKNRIDIGDCLTDFKIQKNEFQPSLVGFKLLKYPKSLSGCRCKARCSLFQKQQLIYSETGEITFKDDGVSGIVILNLSAYYNRLEDKGNCSIHFDLIPDDPDYDEHRHWQQFNSFKGLIHPKLVQYYERNPFSIRNLKFDIKGVYDFEFAQVCHGGIKVEEIDKNFELKKLKKVYVLGEMLDIDGLCGGYNLFFAWASAWIVAQQFYSPKTR